MGGASGRSFGSGWPTAVWSCTRASRRDRHVRDNRPVRTGWCRWRGPDPLERAAAKPAREAKPEDVLVPWLTWGFWNASGCAPISTRSMRSGGQLMTPNSAACELDHAPAAVLNCLVLWAAQLRDVVFEKDLIRGLRPGAKPAAAPPPLALLGLNAPWQPTHEGIPAICRSLRRFRAGFF